MPSFLDIIAQDSTDALLGMLSGPRGYGEGDMLQGLLKPKPDYFSMSSAVNNRGNPQANYAPPKFGMPQPVQQPAMPMPTSAPVTQGFRVPTDMSVTGKHKGLDLGVPEGTVVGALDGGVVEAAGFTPDYGNYVLIRHDWGSSLYAHGAQLHVQTGQQVGRGDTVMLSGKTGRVTGPHLHLETMDNEGVLTDPSSVAAMLQNTYMGLWSGGMTPEELAQEGL